MWDYCGELRRSNIGSTILIDLERPTLDVLSTFKRLYVCLDACKRFMTGCRPLISLDGCFLKGYDGGQLLVAVTQDGNNAFFPLAYAIVDTKCRGMVLSH